MNHGWNDGGYSKVLDVTGYNYGQREDQDTKDHVTYPDRCMIGSESASCTVTRGCYEQDDARGYCPEYGSHISEWSCSVEKAWTDVMEHPFLSGIFLWTGFDYRGEPTPYAWPGQEGSKKAVWVYTNCREVELFQDGESLGKKSCAPHGHLEWQVTYRPGCLKAVGYDSEGREFTDCQETPDEASRIRLTPRKHQLKANGSDTVCIEVSITDGKNRIVSQNGPEIAFALQGPGRILGVGNGDPSCHEPDKADRRSIFAGKALVIIQAGKEAGTVKITAKGEGLEAAACEFILAK